MLYPYNSYSSKTYPYFIILSLWLQKHYAMCAVMATVATNFKHDVHMCDLYSDKTTHVLHSK